VKRLCPKSGCLSRTLKPDSGHTVRFGYFYRSSDSRRIQRYRCLKCGHTFSSATFCAAYRQHKRKANEPLRKLFCSGVSIRRAARLLHLSRATVDRKLTFLATQARLSHEGFLENLKRSERKIRQFQFDEVETFEHSKLKPLSIAMAVTKERKILGFEVSSMPAKGHLTAKALEKYGPRPDRRWIGLNILFQRLENVFHPTVLVESDQNPHYPKVVKTHFPEAKHVTTPGRRGAVVGQGELKKIPWDPIFAFNHTAAMLRANINRLFRKTWCTTKRPEKLREHLYLYVQYHNDTLTA
jgi:hypothetical protein